MDDLMTGINVPSGTGGVGGGQPQHSQLSAQGVYDPTGGAAASAPTSTSDDILSALDQVNNAFGHLGESSSGSAANAQSAPQPTGYGAQQSSYGQQSAPQSAGYGAQQSGYGQQSAPQSTGYSAQQSSYGQQSAPQSTGYGAQQGGYGQQSAPQSTGYGAQQSSYGQQSAPQSTGYGAQQGGYGQQSAPQPAKVNDMGYSSDDYKYDPRRTNYGQRSTPYGNTPPAQQQAGYSSPQSGYGRQTAGYGTNQSGYSSDDYRYDPYKNYNSNDSMVTRAVGTKDTEFMTAVKGGIGAIIGAIPGMLLMIMVARFGFIAAICGAAMAFCIFFGYKLMTRNSWVSAKVGIVICAVVMIIAVYLSVRISWTLALQDAIQEAESAMRSLLGGEYSGETKTFIKEIVGGDGEISFGNCWDNFGNIMDMLNMNGRYIGSLAENYVFAAIGGIGTFMKFGREN
ncbi:hypothetical protein [Ruminococcus flavefaciens]|uniref:Uncharacterized protein n=1 Tax=Ruminococcus flavefaciens TaxID=1265 RepID=A0A315XYZ0_RUMFL|nr:hypothetical protein [Ruminococcus flavefaciens]PWJ12598.1 hypothetical protein IE37_01681 [Ruminococcus flavefaciens]SSA49077.1 hypothetical protein SAMN02910325_01681 [Ruminococcus flavefaciens]